MGFLDFLSNIPHDIGQAFHGGGGSPPPQPQPPRVVAKTPPPQQQAPRMVAKPPAPNPLPMFQNAAKQQQQKNAQIEKPGNDPVGDFVNKYVLPSHVVQQVKTLPDAVAANVAAHTNNRTAYQHAEQALNNAVSNGKGLLNPQQTNHPTVANIMRGTAEGVGEIAPFVVGSGTGKLAEKGLTETAGPVERQLVHRSISALSNLGAGTGSNLSIQAGNNQKLNVPDAIKSSLVQAAIGGAAPGKISEAPKPTKVSLKSPSSTASIDAKSFLHGENSNGVGVAKLDAGKGNTGKDFLNTVERNIKYLQGNKASNDIRVLKLAKESAADNSSNENVYHHLEDSKVPVTGAEARTAAKIRTIQNATQQIKGTMKDTEPKEVGNNYVHRIAEGHNTKLEQMLNSERMTPTENAMRMSTDSDKRAKMMAIVDNKGNRQVVSVQKGRVTALTNGQEDKDLGPLKKNLPDQIKESYDPAQRQALADTAKNLGVSHDRVVKIRGNAAGFSVNGAGKVVTRAATPDDVILHELGHQADEKFGIQKQFFGGERPKSDMILDRQVGSYKKLMNDLPKDSPQRGDYQKMIKDTTEQKAINNEMRDLADQRAMTDKPGEKAYLRKGSEKVATMFQAYLHAPDLFKETAPKTFAKFDDFMKNTKEMKPMVDMKPSLKLESNIVGDKRLPGQFIDKAGNKYKLDRATTKEIEANTDTRYIKNAALTSAVDHANTADAASASNFKTWLTEHPEFKNYAHETGDGATPKGYEPAQSEFFRGHTFSPEMKEIVDRYMPKASEPSKNPILRAGRTLNTAATQLIVANPLIHGQNLLVQALIQSGGQKLGESGLLSKIPAGPLGMARFVTATKDMVNPEARASIVHDYLQNGGHLPEYGKNAQSTISDALHAANLPNVNKQNAKWMSDLDKNIRITQYHSNVMNGMAKTDAVDEVDKFLGSKENVGPLAKSIGMFYHWLTTEVKATGSTVKSPGALANAATLGALAYGTDKGIRAVTGNPNAHTRVPGELGLINDAGKAVNDLRTGHGDQGIKEATSVASSHVNPLVNTLLNQAYGEDLYSGKQLNSGKDRVDEAINNLVSPAQNVSKVMGGKQNLLTGTLAQLGGTYLPHATGNPAAPNISALNAKGDKPAQGGDKTGYSQEQQYYDAYDKATAALRNDPKALSAFQLAYGPTKNPENGKYMDTPNVEMTVAKSAALNAYPEALAQATKMNQMLQKQGQKIDPYFTLSPAQQKAYNAYETMAPGSADRTDWQNKNSWYTAFAQKEQDYFNSLPASSPDKPQNPIKYPTPSKMVASEQTAYNSITDKTAKTDYLNNHPDLVAQFASEFKYDNQVRVARGYAALKGSPQATKPVQDFINAYDSADKAGRSAMRNGNPGGYQAMVAYFDSADLNTVAKQSGVNQLQGEPDTSQSELKAISGLAGDIYKNANGTYDIVPAGWMNGLTNGSSGGGSGGSGYSSSYSSDSYPVPATAPSDASTSKLRSLLNQSTKITKPSSSVSLKKSATSKSGNYHVKQMSQEKTEKPIKYARPKGISSVRKNVVKLSV